ncbi:MAG: HAMP domain-containing sensor histidine kinase [Rubrivivax sp.]|nr:HAMP domain-containing sensor histidine kinase [Rubrivivax sp.]
MRSLYLRIYLTVVVALALFAGVSGWLVQRHLEEQRVQAENAVRERLESWGEMVERAMPPATAPAAQQIEVLREWSQRLRLPMALDDAAGQRLGASDSYTRREFDTPAMAPRLRSIRFDDGRTLWVARQNQARPMMGARHADLRPMWMGPQAWPDGLGLVLLLVVLFMAVAAGAWPVVRRLTRRLEALKQGVEAFGAGALHQRVAEDGRDEVAALGASFNRAAGRIEALLRSHQSLLANASHELRSPLSRLKMAVTMMEDAPPAQRAALRKEIDTDVAELDALVEEVLLASRLDAAAALDHKESVDLLAVAAEEASRVGATAQGDDARVTGDERLLRRAVRNLLENARRYGGDEVEATVAGGPGHVELRVCDRGPGVPEAWRERIFEAFFRLPGHAEREGGVGLGLSLVRQIAQRHGGSVRCEPRAGGGSCFVLQLPVHEAAGARA